jgi:hypothetical protein
MLLHDQPLDHGCGRGLIVFTYSSISPALDTVHQLVPVPIERIEDATHGWRETGRPRRSVVP